METQENLAIESTTSQGQGTSESNGSAVPKGQELDNCSNTGSKVDGRLTETQSQQPFLTIRHNHEDKGLSEQEAVTLAQKGMAYDSVFNAVARAAALQGKNIKEFVKGFEVSADESYRKTLVEKYGDDTDTIDALMELYFVKKEDKIKSANSDGALSENAVNTKLQGQFNEFKKHFPEVQSFDDLPPSVKQGALNGQDLLSEYLRYRFFETQKAEAAKLNALAASDASVGSAATDEQVESAETAFIKGLRMV